MSIVLFYASLIAFLERITVWKTYVENLCGKPIRYFNLDLDFCFREVLDPVLPMLNSQYFTQLHASIRQV